MDSALIIFVRQPELGKVKTRLAATIGNENALLVYKFLLKHTHGLIKDLPLHVYVYYTGEIVNDLWKGNNIIKRQQTGIDLGEKMQQAFSEVLKDGYSKVIIIGSDCYELTTDLINESLDMLNNNEAVIGPAKDGGYYLLGLKKVLPELFENIPWSTSEVLGDTIKRLYELNCKYYLLKELSDIDDEKDITEEIKEKAGVVVKKL